MEEARNKEMIELLKVRGGTYRLLSRLWAREVDEALWEELRAISFPSVTEIPILDGAYRTLEGALKENGELKTLLENLAADYAILCLGASRRDGADPYESVHLSKDNIMMQDEWEQMLYLYYELGLQRSENTSELEDHLAMELECIAILCERAVEATNSGDIPGVSWSISQQVGLLDDHLLKWVPSFVRKVLDLASTEFYKAVAVITREYLTMDRELLKELSTEEVFQPT
ncbi:MAG: molecular chaperone TorD family protein [Anaerolineales bacterium]|nr:molecular chaperone TorD family protein [Anaerolineales bacterium]